jgi:histidinol-phosphatase
LKTMNAEQSKEYLDFGLSLAKAAEKHIMRYYRDHTIQFKADRSEVTEADRQAEETIREMIAERFPRHAILGEELGAKNASTQHCQYQWLIDPLDGTTWYTIGVPIFGTLIALLENREPVLGVIHFPALRETVYACRGSGCWFKVGDSEPVRVQVMAGVPLKAATVSASGVHGSDILLYEGRTPYKLTALIRQAGRFRFCGDCLQHALVCRGKIHAAVDTIMQPWDSAAIIPCIEEAGGIATTISGRTQEVAFGGSLVTSCGEPTHGEVRKSLQMAASSM